MLRADVDDEVDDDDEDDDPLPECNVYCSTRERTNDIGRSSSLAVSIGISWGDEQKNQNILFVYADEEE